MQIPQVSVRSEKTGPGPEEPGHVSSKGEAGGAFASLLAQLQNSGQDAPASKTGAVSGEPQPVAADAKTAPGSDATAAHVTAATASPAAQGADKVPEVPTQSEGPKAQPDAAAASPAPQATMAGPESQAVPESTAVKQAKATAPPNGSGPAVAPVAPAKAEAEAATFPTAETSSPIAGKAATVTATPADTSPEVLSQSGNGSVGNEPAVSPETPSVKAAVAQARKPEALVTPTTTAGRGSGEGKAAPVPATPVEAEAAVTAAATPASPSPSDNAGEGDSQPQGKSTAAYTVNKTGAKPAQAAGQSPAAFTAAQTQAAAGEAAEPAQSGGVTVQASKVQPAATGGPLKVREPAGETAARIDAVSLKGFAPEGAAPNTSAPGVSTPAQPAAQAVSAPGHGAQAIDRVPLPMVPEAVIKGVRFLLNQEEQTMRIRLVPESLGELRLEVSSSGGQVSVRMTSASHAVRELLHTHVQSLRDALSSDGASTPRITIGAETGAGGGIGPDSGSAGRAFPQFARPWGGGTATASSYTSLVRQQPAVVPRRTVSHGGTLNLFA